MWWNNLDIYVLLSLLLLFFYITERISSDNYSGTLYNFIGVVFEVLALLCIGVLGGCWYVQYTWNLARRNFEVNFVEDTAEGPFTTVCLITRPARRLSVDNWPTIGRFHKILARINSLIDFEWPWMSQNVWEVQGKTNLLTCEREKPKTFSYTGQSLKYYLGQIQMTRVPATIP